MLLKNKKTRLLLTVAFLLSFSSQTLPMARSMVRRLALTTTRTAQLSRGRLLRAGTWVRNNPVKTVGTATSTLLGYSYYKQMFDLHNHRSYLDGLQKTSSPSDILAQKLQLLRNSCNAGYLNFNGSQSFQHVYKLLGKPTPEVHLDGQLKEYQNAIRELLNRHYEADSFQTGCPDTQESVAQLTDTVTLFSVNEILHSDTHFAFYTGTRLLSSILFRTKLYCALTQKKYSEFFLLRNPGSNDALRKVTDITAFMSSFNAPKRIQSPLSSVGRSSPHDYHDNNPAASTAFLSTNVFAMGNSNSNGPLAVKNGSNSLCLLAKPTIPFPGLNHSDSNVNFIKETLETAFKYKLDWNNLSTRISLMCAPVSESGVLIQVLVPKTYIKNKRAYLAARGGRARNVNLFDYLNCGYRTDNNSDEAQARLALDPDFFENPESGVKMSMVVLGNPEELKEFISKCDALVREITKKTG